MSAVNQPDNKADYLKKEGPIFRLASFFVTLFVVVMPFWIFMKIFTKTRIIGKEKLDQAKLPFLFVSNHVSMLDDMFIGSLLFAPRGMFNYKFMPYHTPEQQNFYKGPVMSWIMEHLKCIPLTRGKGLNQPGVNEVIERLKDGGTVHIYPEGTRTRSGRLGAAKPGVGKIAYESKCAAVPCYHHGIDKILPIGRKFPKPFQKVTIIVGDPMNLDEFFKMENKADTWKKISVAMVTEIRRIRDEAKANKII
ncbi:MAG: 1-acyl-sn-glycerol-3-phosphate acyltransferase [FCB group bacterium]|nr:1-acyl-sn-glycerol-3-phosphate acyltransferase [FCB group bacterium]